RPGRIINVSSGVTQAAVRGVSPYATSKIALEGLTRNLACDADGTGIMVTCIQVGSTRTPMAKRFFKWEEYELLPPPECLAPVFWYAATADPSLLHGRIIASWRFNLVGEAEPRLAMPIAGVERFTFGEKPAERYGRAEPIVLNRAENQLGAPPAVRELLGTASASEVWRYPDMDYTVLRCMLAEKLQLGRDCLTFGNGSAELVERILRVLVKPGEAVLSNDPSWFMFDRFAHMFGIVNEKVPFVPHASDGYSHNLDGILAAIRGDTRLIYLIHPSNPVGVPLLHDEFAAFLARVPAHIPVVVDEAYIEFANHPRALDTPRLLRETGRMLIGLRTFSKFYGLAGMRVGYGYASPDVIRLLGRLELPFNVSSVSAAAAVAALKDEAHAARTRENCIAERARIGEFLRAVDLDYVPTQGNMMMFEPPTEPQAFYGHLEKERIVPPRGVFLGKYTLWPIALPPHNDRMMAVVRSLV
ncbi:MAG TPA: aminotransferase class I/II-fold pyridoxal phosphate-dependent enzyme, partial [Burkholderiales bacterium]|nr:aminotransferase class I/II-fold pyridoxal phosphate-dependent enzyme [Burkholderiales bacterium]